METVLSAAIAGAVVAIVIAASVEISVFISGSDPRYGGIAVGEPFSNAGGHCGISDSCAMTDASCSSKLPKSIVPSSKPLLCLPFTSFNRGASGLR